MNIALETEYPLAVDSPDYRISWGTRRDNSKNPRFNKKLYRLFEENRPIKVLDLGCSGGGFIESIIEDGHIGVGLEGSDWSKNLGRGAWGKIQTLFTCDITKQFQIWEEYNNGKSCPVKFDVITAWDVLEHIASDDIPDLVENIVVHLDNKGLFIASIDDANEIIHGAQLHQTVKPQDWWENKLKRLGRNQLSVIRYFNRQFVRGGKYDPSFNLALSSITFPVIETPLKERIMDKWRGSKIQRRVISLLR